MNKSEMIKWLQNLKKDIGQSQHQDLWHYAEMLDEVIGIIEVGENAISREYMLEQLHKAEEEKGGTFETDSEKVRVVLEHAPSVITQVPNEDAISRESLLKHAHKRDGVMCVSVDSIRLAPSVTTEQSSEVGEWKWETDDICHNCGYKIPHLERIVGETVLMDSKDWSFCPNCGSRR